MFAKSFFASALLTTSALAAPTISNSAPAELEKRADWQAGKCEAHIFVDVGGPWVKAQDLHWTVNIIDNAGNGIGSMINRKNPPISDRVVETSKGPFRFMGEPRMTAAQDALTFRYGNQEWNSVDCYKYTFEDHKETDSGKDKHNWWCQFVC